MKGKAPVNYCPLAPLRLIYKNFQLRVVGFGLFASTSTSTTSASHGACAGLPVGVEGLLSVEGHGAPVVEEVDASERDELVHLHQLLHPQEPHDLRHPEGFRHPQDDLRRPRGWH